MGDRPTYNISLYGCTDCNLYNHDGKTYYTHIDFPMQSLEDPWVLSIVSNGVFKSINELTRAPDGVYSWVCINGVFYAKRIWSVMETFAKHNQILKLIYIDHPELFINYSNYDEFIDNDLDVLTFFSGELIKNEVDVTINMLSGTYMLNTKERVARILGFPIKDVDYIRYKLLMKQLPATPLHISYTDSTIISRENVSDMITDYEVELILSLDGIMSLFASKSECKMYSNYDMKLIAWKTRRDMYERGVRFSDKDPDSVQEKMRKWLETNRRPIKPIPKVYLEKS